MHLADSTLHLEVNDAVNVHVPYSCSYHSNVHAIMERFMFESFSDASGKIRIWDTTQKEHLLKYEYTPISGKIKDIAWTEDSKRIAVVGDGREK